MDDSFFANVEKLLEVSERTELLREENEQLAVRLESLCSRVGGIWEDVERMRDELEIRIARLELRTRGREDPSTVELLQTREAECGPYEDTWNDLHTRVRALEEFSSLQSGVDSQLSDTLDLSWLREEVRSSLAKMRQTGRVNDDDAPVPPVPARDDLIAEPHMLQLLDDMHQQHEDDLQQLKQQVLERKQQEEQLQRARAPSGRLAKTTGVSASDPAEMRLARESLLVKAPPPNTARTLRVSVLSSRLTRGDMCIVEIEGRKRAAPFHAAALRATQTTLSMVYHKFTEDSRIAIRVYETRQSRVLRDKIVSVRDVVRDRDVVVDFGDLGQFLLRFELVVSENTTEVLARRFIAGPPSEGKKTARGGAHVSVPRFVKKLKALRQLKELYAPNSAQLPAPHAATLEDEFVKPFPDLKWMEEQVLSGWDGPVVFNPRKQTLLHLLAMAGTPKAVRALLKKGKKWDPHLKDADGWSPFMLMVARQFTEGVQIMLFNGASPLDSVWGVSPLHLAALAGSVDLTKTLLEHNQSLAVAVDDRFATPLHYAAYGHRTEVAALLLDVADPNVQDLDGQTPLLTAILRKSVPMVDLLLDRGAIMTAKEVWGAVVSGDEKVLNRVLERAPPEVVYGPFTPHGHGILSKALMVLTERECVAAFPIILYCSAPDVNHEDSQKRTPAFYACLFGKPVALKLLLEVGANAQHLDLFGNNLLHVATTPQVIDVLSEYTDCEALGMQKNVYGHVPLVVAHTLQNRDVCSALLALDPSAEHVLFEASRSSLMSKVCVPFMQGQSDTDFLK